MKPSLDPTNLGNLNYTDLTKFIQIVENTRTLRPDERRTFTNLVNGLGKFSTIYGQVNRIAEFFLRDSAALAQRSSPYKKSGVDLLFAEHGDEIGLRPTPLGQIIYNRFRVLVDCYQNTRAEILRELQGDEAVVLRLAAPQTFFIRLLAPMFSKFKDVFGNVRLIMSSTPSSELVRRLHVGLLDFGIVYGLENRLHHVPDPNLDVSLSSLGYYSRMVLLCPHDHVVHTKRGSSAQRRYGKDVNSGYWDAYKSAPPAGKDQNRLGYDDARVRELNLDDVDFDRDDSLPLISVPSWEQPRPLAEITERLLLQGKIQESAWYDEALARTRMGMGVAPATEVFGMRAGVTAFRLLPKKEYTRWISICYNHVLGIPSKEAYYAIRFIREYLTEFAGEVRHGMPPGSGHERYDNLCAKLHEELVGGTDWRQAADKEYPIEDQEHALKTDNKRSRTTPPQSIPDEQKDALIGE